MPYPNATLAVNGGTDQGAMESYLGQLHLRKHLNTIHKSLYAPQTGSAGPSTDDKHVNFHNVRTALDNFAWIPAQFAFKLDDPPATEILHARLRAKYWGSEVITYRPFVKQILNFSHKLAHSPPETEPLPPLDPTDLDVHGKAVIPSIPPNARHVDEINPIIIEFAQTCIRALIESTRAFHGLGEARLIVTNIFGTAHA